MSEELEPVRVDDHTIQLKPKAPVSEAYDSRAAGKGHFTPIYTDCDTTGCSTPKPYREPGRRAPFKKFFR